MNEKTPLEKYLQLIEYWKVNIPIFTTKKHVGYEAHHPIPKSFRKIKQEFKNEITFQLEKFYSINEVVIVPYHIHFELHTLLVEIFPKQSQEWFKMNNTMFWLLGNNKIDKYQISSEDYTQIKTRAIEALSMLKATPEGKIKSHNANLGRKPTDEARKNMSVAQLIVQNRSELKEKSKNRTELWKNDDYRKSVKIAMKAGHTDEVRKKKSIAQKITQNLPEVRMKTAETNGKIEVYEKRSIAISKSFEKRDKDITIKRMQDANIERFKDLKEREKASKKPKLFFVLRRMAKRLATIFDIEDVKITSSISVNRISKLYVHKQGVIPRKLKSKVISHKI